MVFYIDGTHIILFNNIVCLFVFSHQLLSSSPVQVGLVCKPCGNSYIWHTGLTDRHLTSVYLQYVLRKIAVRVYRLTLTHVLVSNNNKKSHIVSAATVWLKWKKKHTVWKNGVLKSVNPGTLFAKPGMKEFQTALQIFLIGTAFTDN